jgi:hypothetical protein
MAWQRDMLAEHFVEADRAKTGYATFQEAQDAADSRNQTRAPDERPWRAYKCGYCDEFHVGHSSNPKRRRKRRRR